MEDVSRAIGAASSEPLIINGKECQVRPLTLRELGELERECVRQYRKEYLARIADSRDLLPNAEEYITAKVEETALWTTDNLPRVSVFGTAQIPITTELEYLLEKELLISKTLISKGPDTVRRILATALDQKILTADQVEKATGVRPKEQRTGYANWWCTGHPDGMMHMIWLTVRDSGISKEEVVKFFTHKQEEAMLASRQIEAVTAPAMGNG